MRIPHIQRFLFTGLLTVFPLWLTWVVFELVLTQLSKVGAPIVDAVFNVLSPLFPSSTYMLDLSWLRFALAVLLTLAVLYSLGALANRVIGKRLLAWIDSLIARIPLVHSIYGGTKKLLSVLAAKPEGAQRVVLIDFPNRDMKVVGFVTRVIREEGSGRELAAVYVPTTPNPTSGYLEIVPVENLTPTDWSVDQAMAFIISGGAVSPDQIPYSRPAPAASPAAIKTGADNAP
ncbi:MAG: DUF502 domain-containing protein [Xanthomonadaceae bacterium]|nr:DUF502 domain-containing protein [Xanthomonadaceae bacterium]MDP2184090.1 DUF502 domain-containing protein [Xanthomonadales bacterium]MDZ4115189.1 DUF502 domain-containing protein [Xanthomonadaceae bacterium]MDZ4377035.1 DUF502 domain-containing protein [Xanthomonadaceae bacterium]